MAKKLLLGDEALAQGALDAGISGAYAYPGTPSTEIFNICRTLRKPFSAAFTGSGCNEKVAMEEALGMSYAGKRSIVCMKHVGLNVAADAFINSAVTGTNGGLLVVVADDPSMHSSQNEQDSRFYSQFAMVPCLEPSNQQEAYDMVLPAFALSEQLQTPVLFRLSTRLSHSRADIVLQEALPEKPLSEPEQARRFVLLPAIARQNYRKLCDKQTQFLQLSEQSQFNRYIPGEDKSLGVIASGLAFNYLQEAYGGACHYPVLKISQYPLPSELLRRLLHECEKIMVIEEGMPFIESQLRGPVPDTRILGRLSGALPRDGELNPRLVRLAFGLPVKELAAETPLLRNRPPRLCDGCPHIDSYRALTQALQGLEQARVFGDIGCYTLGALPPFNAISTCVDMGASISMAKGASDAGLSPAVAVIGDSTFTHSGMTALLDAIWENASITVIIVDNFTTGMTGGQTSMGQNRLEDICLGLGLAPEHLRIMLPLPKKHSENVELIRQELAYQGLSVIIAQRECIQTIGKKKLTKK